MKKIIIDDVAQITTDVIKLMDDFESVLIVGYYETIVEAFNLLMKLTDNEFAYGELHPADYDNYEDAYYLECDGGQLYFGKARWDDHDKYIAFVRRTAFAVCRFFHICKKTEASEDTSAMIFPVGRKYHLFLFLPAITHRALPRSPITVS